MNELEIGWIDQQLDDADKLSGSEIPTMSAD